MCTIKTEYLATWLLATDYGVLDPHDIVFIDTQAQMLLKSTYYHYECHYLVSVLTLLLMSYFIAMITSITDMYISLTTPYELQI